MLEDETTTVGQLKARVRGFSVERDWEQFHTPKNLGVALVCEVGELLEHFRYRTDAEVSASLADPTTQRAVADELADCLWLILRLADVTEIDLASSLEAKLADAARKYPIDRAFGRSDKYTAYVDPPERGRGDSA